MTEARRSSGATRVERLVDVSIPFDPATPPWPGDTAWSCGWTTEMAKGGSVNLTCLNGSPHVGTHADAPLHVSADGAGADALPLLPFVGGAQVVDVSTIASAITLEALDAAGVLPHCTRLILKTGRTTAKGTFPDGWPSLAPEAATELVARGLRLLAVDCPSVDPRDSKSLDVHHAVFDGGACVLENLDLREIEPGHYELLALPMPVGAIDAAPVRALLRSVP